MACLLATSVLFFVCHDKIGGRKHLYLHLGKERTEVVCHLSESLACGSDDEHHPRVLTIDGCDERVFTTARSTVYECAFTMLSAREHFPI